MNYKVGFIGAGNMGGALAAAVGKAKVGTIAVAERNEDRVNALSELFSVDSVTNEEIAKSCKYIFLGVKPQNMGEMLGELADALKNRTDGFILVSMAAGLAVNTIKEMAGGDYPVIRIMPNTPVRVGKGMILFSPCNLVTDDEVAEFKDFMQFTGTLLQMDEKDIDAGCAVSGCGPAFVFMFAEALVKGGVACGLKEETAKTLALATLEGAARLAAESEDDLATLRKNVCSPGGSTIEGVKIFEERGLYDIGEEAVIAAYKRSVELGKK